MFSVKVNEKYEFRIEPLKGDVLVDDVNTPFDCLETERGKFNILIENHSYNAEVLEVDHVAKSFLIKVNGKKQRVVLKDKFDLLLSRLGMDNLMASKVNEIKAPMPGLVLNIMVEENQVIKKGEPLFVLEAMKMENVIKSPGDGIIKKIRISVNDKVEKNQVLIQLD